MSLFSAIKDKIFQAGAMLVHHEAAAAPASSMAAPAPGQTLPGQTTTAPHPAPAPAPAPSQPVDVEATLSQMAAQKGGGNWRTSIVDLLKLLDLDSSLEARKGLAAELNVHAGADGGAEENIALHKAVMAKLAENGGKVPDSLRG